MEKYIVLMEGHCLGPQLARIKVVDREFIKYIDDPEEGSLFEKDTMAATCKVLEDVVHTWGNPSLGTTYICDEKEIYEFENNDLAIDWFKTTKEKL